MCSTTADTQFATWAAVEYLARRAVTRVREPGDAHRKSAGNARGSRGCRVKRKNLRGPSGKYKNWRCEPLSFAYFSLRRQRKVGAAPHRGDALSTKANRGCQRRGKHTTATPAPRRRQANARTVATHEARRHSADASATTSKPNQPRHEDIMRMPAQSPEQPNRPRCEAAAQKPSQQPASQQRRRRKTNPSNNTSQRHRHT